MNNTPDQSCRVCGNASCFAFAQPVLDRSVAYFDCPTCGYVQTETPDWLDRAYSRAITAMDTGIMARNLLNVDRVLMTLFVLGRLRGRVIDHAGGYGILVRMLRDVGVDARWRDMYCENLLAGGFEATDSGCDLMTAFELFEHLVDPVTELSSMLTQAPAVLISTDLVTSPKTPPHDWWYYGPEHGQHIGFFRTGTLQWMADRLGCHHATDGLTLHLFSRAPVPSIWRAAVRLRRLAPIIARLKLSPRTNVDFDELRKAR